MTVDRDTRPVHFGELDLLDFVGEPFDPGRWVLGGDGAESSPRGTPPSPVRAPNPLPRTAVDPVELDRAVAALVHDIRQSVVAAHASSLDVQSRLQHRTVTAFLPHEAGVRPW